MSHPNLHPRDWREELAEELHCAYKPWRERAFNISDPLWFALSDEYKQPFLDAAQRLLERDGHA